MRIAAGIEERAPEPRRFMTSDRRHPHGGIDYRGSSVLLFATRRTAGHQMLIAAKHRRRTGATAVLESPQTCRTGRRVPRQVVVNRLILVFFRFSARPLDDGVRSRRHTPNRSKLGLFMLRLFG
jgi:hypothetical protein